MSARRRLAARAVALLAASVAAPLAAQRAPTAGAVVVTPGTFVVGGDTIAVEEGRLVVPARHALPDGATLTLAFVRFPSTAAAPGAPIVFLAGGPGDAATRALGGMPPALLARLRAIGDVVAFDQRGTGRSEPRGLACAPGAPTPRDRPGDPHAQLLALRARLAACLDAARGAGVDVGALTTAESADDLEALRRALGAPRLALFAGSYGTHLALSAVRRHPALVSRMALLGVEGPDDTFKLPSRVDAVVDEIARARRASLADDLRGLAARLDTAPVTHAFPTRQAIVLGGWDLRRWVAGSLDTRREIDALVAAVPAMRDGRFDALAAATLRARLAAPLGLMNVAMDCASYASVERLARIEREAGASLVGRAMDFPRPMLCEGPGLPRLPDAHRAAVRSDVPALLVSGTFDGRTPVANARDVARHLPNARLLVVDGAAHDLFGAPGVMEAVLAFLRE